PTTAGHATVRRQVAGEAGGLERALAQPRRTGRYARVPRAGRGRVPLGARHVGRQSAAVVAGYGRVAGLGRRGRLSLGEGRDPAAGPPAREPRARRTAILRHGDGTRRRGGG